MKTGNYFGGLVVGTLIGVGIGYWIATDPVKRRKINRFINEVEDKFEDVKEKIMEAKDNLVSSCGCGASDEDFLVEAIIAAEEADLDNSKK